MCKILRMKKSFFRSSIIMYLTECRIILIVQRQAFPNVLYHLQNDIFNIPTLNTDQVVKVFIFLALTLETVIVHITFVRDELWK